VLCGELTRIDFVILALTRDRVGFVFFGAFVFRCRFNLFQKLDAGGTGAVG
jgi:hypothetical protein